MKMHSFFVYQDQGKNINAYGIRTHIILKQKLTPFGLVENTFITNFMLLYANNDEKKKNILKNLMFPFKTSLIVVNFRIWR